LMRSVLEEDEKFLIFSLRDSPYLMGAAINQA
jgi:hypothetical protein